MDHSKCISHENQTRKTGILRGLCLNAHIPSHLLHIALRPRILEKIGFQPPTYDFEMTFKLVFPRDAKSWLAKSRELPDEAVERSPFLFGTPEDIIEKLDKFAKAGCSHFVMNFQVSPRILKETCQLFAEKVVPYFKEK